MSIQNFSSFHDASESRLKEWHRPYCELLASFSPVLDVGCGPGYFCELICERGGKCIGLDIDPAMVALAKSRGNDAVKGDHRLNVDFSIQFGAVHVSHVIEHLWGQELVDLFEAAQNLLRSGGLLVMRTPNWQNPIVRDFLFWMDHTHKRPYPSELLSRIAQDLGFETIESGHEPVGMLDTYFVAQKRGEGIVRPMPLAWNASPQRWRHRIVRRIRHAARSMLGIE
jgi:O-antigen chain-terminating methyltransferase